MYTIISATNRIGSNTLKVSKQYQAFFKEQGIDAKLLSLEDFNSFYRDENFNQLEAEFLKGPAFAGPFFVCRSLAVVVSMKDFSRFPCFIFLPFVLLKFKGLLCYGSYLRLPCGKRTSGRVARGFCSKD